MLRIASHPFQKAPLKNSIVSKLLCVNPASAACARHGSINPFQTVYAPPIPSAIAAIQPHGAEPFSGTWIK